MCLSTYSLNLGITLPSAPLQVVLDTSSDYSHPFSSALAQAVPDFGNKIGVGTNVTFPVAHPIYALYNGTTPHQLQWTTCKGWRPSVTVD